MSVEIQENFYSCMIAMVQIPIILSCQTKIIIMNNGLESFNIKLNIRV